MILPYCHPQQTKFWELELNDVATWLIAVVNIILLFYVFFYEKKKDTINLKSEWFKTIILDPHVSAIHRFFNDSYLLFSGIDKTTIDQKIDLLYRLNQSCNNIEVKFISLLGCVNQKLENDCLQIIDGFRDDLTHKLIESDSLDSMGFETHITSTKRKLISKLYNFVPSLKS